MRYWGILAAKLIGSASILVAVQYVLVITFPRQTDLYGHDLFLHDLQWTLIMMLMMLFACGLMFLVVLDQRYRCRTCGRRLRMPVSTGRYAQMLLFGRPKTEYICLYGHGTLKVSDLQIGGIESPDWQPHEDIWKELYSLDETKK